MFMFLRCKGGIFDEKSKQMMFIGYNPVSTTGYRLYDRDTGSVCVSRDVIFDESPHPEGVDSSQDRKSVV